MTDTVIESLNEQSEVARGCLYTSKLLGAALIVLIGIVGLKFGFEDRLAPRTTGLEGALTQGRLDLLFMGSSHTRKSYDVQIVEKSIGNPSLYLLSYDGVDFTAISQMLDYMVSRPDTIPKHVVVEAYSMVFARRPELQDPRYFVEAPPSLKSRIIETYFQSHPEPSSLIDVFDLVANRGNDEILAYPFYRWASRKSSYKGGRTDFKFPGLSPALFSKLVAPLWGSEPDPAQIAALEHIMELSRLYHIQLMFIDPPLPQPVSANIVVQSLKRTMRDTIIANGFQYIDGDKMFPIGDSAMFSDSNHLSSDGREKFTALISKELKKWMDSTQPSFSRQ